MATNVAYSQQHSGQMGVSDAGVKGNPYEQYFGRPTGEIKTGAYDRLAIATETLPDAYKGKSLYLRDTIEGYILEANEWYTTLALPWAYTDQLTVTFSSWRFNKTLAGYVPHEGVARMITHSQESKTRHITRRGLAFMIEHAFWKTAIGRETYARNVLGIKQSVQETLNYDVLNEILSAKNYNRKWKDDHGGITLEKVKRYLFEETETYAAVQKPIVGFEVLLGKYRQAASKFGVRPNMLIAPPMFRMYYSKIPRERTQYWLYGPDGTLNLKEGPAAVAQVEDAWVFETRLLDVYADKDGSGVDMLKRERTVGEYYILGDPFVGQNHSRYSSQWLHTYIYDEESDDFVMLRFSDAFDHVRRFQADGSLSHAHTDLARIDPFVTVSNGMEDIQGPYLSAQRSAAMNLTQNANVGEMLSSSKETYFGGRVPVYGKYTYQEQTFDKNRDMFLFVDSNNTFQVVHYMGQMETQYFEIADQKNHAVTAEKLMCEAKITQAEYEEITEFVRALEEVPYNSAFVTGLIQENVKVSVDEDSELRKFNIRRTDAKLAALFGVTSIDELEPNVYGGLNLPRRDPSTMGDYPPLSSSWPQIKTLAAQGARLGWTEAAAAAKKAVSFTRRFGGILAKVYRTSPFVNPDYRAPWFQYADYLTTVWENLVTTPRPAIFLNVLPSSNLPVQSNIIASKSSSSSTEDKISQIASCIPHKKAIIEAISGTKTNQEIKQIINTLYNDVPQVAKINARHYEEDMNDALLLAANYRLSKSNDTDLREQCREARKNIRSILRLLHSEFKSDAKSAKKVHSMIKTTLNLDPEVKDADKRKRAEKILKFSDKFIGGREEEDEAIQQSATLMTNWGGYDENENVDFRALIERKDQIVALARELNLTQPGSLNKVLTATGNGNPVTFDSETSQADRSLIDQINNLWTALVYDLNNIGQGSLNQLEKVLLPSTTTRSTPTRKTRVIPTQDAYRNGYWVRVPLSASPSFVKSLQSEKFPLVLPSNPEKAHMKPVKHQNIESHLTNSIYSTIISAESNSQSGRLAEHTTWLRTMLIPKKVGTSRRRSSSSSFNNIGNKFGEYSNSNNSIGGKRSAANVLVDNLLGDEDRESRYDPYPAENIGYHAEDPYRREQADEYDKWHDPHLLKLSGDEDKKFRNQFTEQYFGFIKSAEFKLMEGNFMSRWSEANKFENPIHRMLSHVFLSSRNEKGQWDAFYEYGVLPPGKIIAWRLWITHQMYTMVYMLGGYETGATFYGGSNAETGDDVVSQFHYATFTFYAKAMVFTPDNIFLAEDVFVKGYVRGCHVKFIRAPSDLDPQHGNHDGDIIATLVPYREGIGRKLPNPMDFTGVYHFPGYDSSQDYANPHYTSAPYYELHYQLDSRSKKQAEITTGFRGRASRQNTTAFHGHQITYNPSTSSYNQVFVGTGHWGGDATGRTAAKVRNGGNEQFREQRWSEYNYASTQ